MFGCVCVFDLCYLDIKLSTDGGSPNRDMTVSPVPLSSLSSLQSPARIQVWARDLGTPSTPGTPNAMLLESGGSAGKRVSWALDNLPLTLAEAPTHTELDVEIEAILADGSDFLEGPIEAATLIDGARMQAAIKSLQA